MKLTKNELRDQQYRLGQLNRYLPTLQLKKAMLQTEVIEARTGVELCQKEYQKHYVQVSEYSALLATYTALDLKVKELKRGHENIAGVEVPYFESITFEKVEYSLFATPPWLDSAIVGLQALIEARLKIDIAEDKKRALEKELRQVSIRVNLFEKILIPRATQNIKKIKIFLGDQQLAAVSRAKVAKEKIEARKA